MHGLCMATKTISIEIDAYELLVRERKDPKESFSRVIRRVLSERPALTAGDLLDAMKAFEGRGAGPIRAHSLSFWPRFASLVSRVPSPGVPLRCEVRSLSDLVKTTRGSQRRRCPMKPP
jgi:predicted CopG family antitoxin